MAEFIPVGVVCKATAVALAKVGEKVLEQHRDQYNEEDIKGKVLSELQLIKDDTKALRNAKFKTARDQLLDWSGTTSSVSSDINIKRLNTARECAAEAFNTVLDPRDKIMAAYFQINAVYHLASLPSSAKGDGPSEPDWTLGKREAQQLLNNRMGGMKELSSAAKEELGSYRRMFKNREKRRQLLCDFVNLSAFVYALPPMSENRNHPRFDKLEKAALHVCEEKDMLMWSARVSHIILEPMDRGTLRGHTNCVNCCAVFCEGTKAISGSNDGTIMMWDLQSGRLIHTLRGHTDGVVCCAVFAEGSRALSGSRDSTLRVWDLQSGQEIRILQGHSSCVTCCAVFEEDNRLLSGSWDNTLHVWDIKSGEEIRALRGHTSSVFCCAVFGEGGKAISGSKDGMLKVWDLGSGREICSLSGHTDCVTCCIVFADGTKAISGSWDNTLKVWDLESGMEIRTLQGHTKPVRCCDVFPDGTKAISGSSDLTLKVWNLLSGKVWDLLSGKEIHTLEGHTHSVSCCSIFADGSRLISGSWDNTLKVWDLPTASPSPESQIVKAE